MFIQMLRQSRKMSKNGFSWYIYIFYTFFSLKQVRLGWHDAGTYNKNIEEWPLRGGANGSLRFEIELKHGANAGNGLTLFIIQFG